MNIVYDMSNESIMRLKFKDDIIDKFDNDTREILDKYVLPIMAMNEKFVLTGQKPYFKRVLPLFSKP